jgi:hypothetical protein
MTSPAVTYIDLNESLKQLRAELKREFPGTKFSVVRSRGTAYGYVSVRWVDGPTVTDVRAITCAYEGQGFDGMTDSTYSIEHTAADAQGNPITVHHATRGISTHRDISPELANQLIARIAQYWGGINKPPVAVPSVWRGETYPGHKLEPAEMGHQNIRMDIDRLDWHTAIHRAAGGDYIRSAE